MRRQVLQLIRMNLKVYIITMVAVGVGCVELSQTKISTTRSELRNSLCYFYNGNFTDSQRQHVKPLISSFSYLTDDQIQKMLFHQNFDSPAIQSILIAAPHALSLFIMLIMVPGLACCCARPDKYPVCKKFRKPEDEMYTRVELKWPAYCTILCYLVISVGAAGALAGGPDITNYVNNIGCRLTAVADDTLHGRISPSDDSVFFVGLTPLKSEFTDFASKLNTFFSQSNTSLNASQAVKTAQIAIQNQIDAQYTSYNDITYTSAFRASDGATYASISSQFKRLYYGPTSDSSKLLGNIKKQLSSLFAEINTALDPMIDEWVYLEGEGQATVRSYLNATIDSISSHEAQLAATISNYGYFDKQQQYSSINLGIKLVYGLVLSLALLGLISAVVITCCTVVRVRMLIYFTCAFLMFMAVITFSMLIVFGIFLPNVSQACAYFDRKLATESGTVELFSSLMFNSSAVLFTKCSSTSGTGDMIDKINSQFTNSFKAIDLLSTYTLQFNELIPNFQPANFARPFTQAATLISQIKTTTKLEINDTVALNFLKGLANKLYTSDPTLCTNTALINGDSWVPSRSVISCQGGAYAQNPCNDLSNTVICPQGCYQMYQQLNTPLGDSAAFATHLNTRYGTGCNYASYIIDLQLHWTTPKTNLMATVQTNINNIKTNVNNYESKVSTIQGNLNSFKSNLVQNFNSLTNLVYGSFNGVDCRVVGESIVQLRDAVCVGLLTSIEYNTIMLCMICYGILMLSCFSVCAGVRHYQHLQKMQVKVGYKGVPVSISSNRINDKFDS